MKVLLLTLSYPEDEDETNIYTDLMQEFKRNGHDVTVVCQRERRSGKATDICNHNGIPVLRVRTGNLTQTKILEKGISILTLEIQFINALKKHLKDEEFNLVLYSTPPITFEKVIKYIKKSTGAATYLLLKDIFPQNAVDIGLIKENSLIHKYFKIKEKELYEISDRIGCMSEGNKRFLLRSNSEIQEQKVEVNPNTILPSKLVEMDKEYEIRQSYGIPVDSILFIYGGNLGKPQGIEFMIKTMHQYRNNKKVYFLIVGSGTEYGRVEKYLEDVKPSNIRLERFIPKIEFDVLVKNSDIGLIYLDSRFTIPNIPSRLTAYMDNAIPVLAITDENTDLKEIIFTAKCGYFSPSGNIDQFVVVMEKILLEKESLPLLGRNGRKYLKENFHVSNSYRIIMQKFIS
ncbi:glycosyltransferase family 4 protein [Sporosarcina sp. CAU 1771]